MPFFSVVLVQAFCWSLASASLASTIRRHDQSRSQTLLQTWNRALTAQSTGARDTPVTRVVGLLKEMQTTLTKEMDEDEASYDKLACWCHKNEVEKNEAAGASQQKMQELTSTIDQLSAKSAGLKASLETLEATIAADKKALAEATAVREKEAAEFHKNNLGQTQDVEDLKAAITVLEKHHGEKSTVPRLVQTDSGSMDFLQASSDWSSDDVAALQRALKSASVKSAFVQYMPTYTSQSGEIMGVLKQLLEEMLGDSAGAEKEEAQKAAVFAELRTAKEAEIASNEKMAESQEDQKATTDNDLANAKEDLLQEEASLDETQKFLKNLGGTCAEAEKNFAERKASRLEEIRAVSETIQILTADEARDVMTSTYSFAQFSSSSSSEQRLRQQKRQVAVLLKRIASKVHSPALAALATSVELDAFTKVKQEIDKMLAMLKEQQAAEVAKNDKCINDLQENDMQTARTNTRKEDLTAKSASLVEKSNAIAAELKAAKDEIQGLQVALQQASEERKVSNLEFQKTVTDQQAVAAVLRTALERLGQYYEKESLLQRASKSTSAQTPPVAQMEYAPSKAAGGVMQMIEKLIQEAQQMTAEARSSESAEQAAYESLVADTNDSVAALSASVSSKTKAKASTDKAHRATEGDIADTSAELEGLGKTNADLHEECDFVMKNFNTRQKARAEEMEGLEQAKQILSGASLS